MIPNTNIPNHLLDALATADCLSGADFRTALFVLRYTLGFHRNTAMLTTSYIANGTGLSERQVRRAVHHLIEVGLICRESEKTLQINLSWRTILSARADNSVRKGGQFCPQGRTILSARADNSVTQENKDKENKDKENKDKEKAYTPKEETEDDDGIRGDDSQIDGETGHHTKHDW